MGLQASPPVLSMTTKMLSFFHLFPQDGEGDFFFPAQASNLAKFNDWLFYYILIVSAVFFFAIMLAAGYFSWKYHKSRCPEPQPSPSHSNTIEFVWSVIPTIFLAYMFWQGFLGFMNRQNPPADAYQVHAQGQKWNWIFPTQERLLLNFPFPEVKLLRNQSVLFQTASRFEG